MTNSTKSDELHVIPVNDLKDHLATKDCWCRPIQYEDGIIIHNSLDRREDYEKSIN